MNIITNLNDTFARVGGRRTVARPGCSEISAAVEAGADWPQDEISLSPLVAAAASAGLDTGSSEARQMGARLQFRLNFASQHVKQLSAEGSFEAERGELSLSVSFTFQRQVTRNGRQEVHTFQAQLKLRASNVQSVTARPFEEKEDIGLLLRRLVDDIMDIAWRDNTRLAGVVFDHEDWMELAAVDRGRTLNALAALIQMVIAYTHQLKAMKEGKRVQDITLTPQRQKTAGVRVHQEATIISEFSLEVTLIPPAPFSQREKGENAGVSETLF
jgi:hypothetical protein